MCADGKPCSDCEIPLFCLQLPGFFCAPPPALIVSRLFFPLIPRCVGEKKMLFLALAPSCADVPGCASRCPRRGRVFVHVRAAARVAGRSRDVVVFFFYPSVRGSDRAAPPADARAQISRRSLPLEAHRGAVTHARAPRGASARGTCGGKFGPKCWLLARARVRLTQVTGRQVGRESSFGCCWLTGCDG